MANQYELANKRKNNTPAVHDSAKGKIGATVAASGIDIACAVAGSAGGFFFPRGAFWAGLIAVGGGHYFDNKFMKSLGIGLMASGGIQLVAGKTVNGPEPELDGFKEKFEAFKQSWMEKLFLDKIMKKKATTTTATTTTTPATNGFGDIQYFSFPPVPVGAIEELSDITETASAALPVSGPEEMVNTTLSATEPSLDMSGLDAIEEQVLNQGMAGLQGSDNNETIAEVPEELHGDRAVETFEPVDISEKLY